MTVRAHAGFKLMMRSVFQFCSMLAAGVMTLGVVAIVLPWVQGHTLPAGRAPLSSLQFESAVFGLTLGLSFGVLARYHWADIPRRLVTWFLVRERQFFYYALILGCLAVVIFY